MKKRLYKFLSFFVFTLLCISVLASCAKSTNNNNDSGTINSDGIIFSPNTNRKIVYTVTAVIESKNLQESIDLVNQTLAWIDQKSPSELLTYTEYSRVSENSVALKLRIKTEYLTDFTQKIQTFGKQVNQTMQTEDITNRYSQLSATITAFEAEVDYIEAILLAETDYISRQQYLTRLTELNIAIGEYKNNLAAYDETLEYSQVNLNIYVKGRVPASERYTSRVKGAFVNSWQIFITAIKEIFIIVVTILPFILIISAVLVSVHFWLKFTRKKAQNKKEIDKDNEQDKQN